ncbi:hypothetical protein SODALDRAFT_170664 [Sodiomyces alkalinus F11]|uniref:Secreted protein n=1 Tax=Sodiomyces alkalinus (strain CBS 110278 / VKM F-3762 / F11) TaxID=1314773 RepID=A0A3N2PWB2_SODAK|nr:hypothetical protein SODALDRAFT_170664 [Sodiomyces alkalinus F11]ROT38774.1 hypothetical protein SODALDRAFT_170664 [Sodiomyces alkalinus F11]
MLARLLRPALVFFVVLSPWRAPGTNSQHQWHRYILGAAFLAKTTPKCIKNNNPAIYLGLADDIFSDFFHRGDKKIYRYHLFFSSCSVRSQLFSHTEQKDDNSGVFCLASQGEAGLARNGR